MWEGGEGEAEIQGYVFFEVGGVDEAFGFYFGEIDILAAFMSCLCGGIVFVVIEYLDIIVFRLLLPSNG